MWIDEAGVIRRMSFDDQATTTRERRSWTTTALWDYGLTVEIDVPSEADLVTKDA